MHALLHDRRRRLGFCALFGVYVLVLAVALDGWGEILSLPYQHLIATLSAALLNGLGVDTVLVSGPQAANVLRMERIVFLVTEECSGIYALTMFLAAVLAYPATGADRLRALVLGVPGFVAYSALRLVLLGLVAHVAPGWTQFLHVYLLVIVNAGFLICLWATWVNRLPTRRVPA